MFRLGALLVIAAALIGCGPPPSPTPQNTSPPVALEFRKADDAPADGLKEAVVAGSDRKVYLHPETELSNADLASANATTDKNGKPAVGIHFNKAGQEKVQRLSKEQMNKPLAILIDGKVVCAPLVRAEIRDAAEINGDFTQAEVDRIVHGLQSAVR